jgi:CheY-like chemotaxis protein
MAGKPSLLIVDDEAGVLLTLQLLFQDAGYLVATAASEAEALQQLRKPGKFDAVITDMSMENKQSGLEVAKAAAQLQPRPAIVVFTGFGIDEDVRSVMVTTVDHFALNLLTWMNSRVFWRSFLLREVTSFAATRRVGSNQQ